MEDLDKIHKCINCDKDFTYKEVGSMDCMTHPLKFNCSSGGDHYGADHYDCCGASIFKDDFTHYEASEPSGCHKIDHVSSKEELDGILRKPFICILNSSAKSLFIANKETGINQRFISISSKESLEYSYGFKMPFKRIYQIDIKKVYEDLLGIKERKPLVLENQNKKQSSAEYYVYSQEEHDSIVSEWLKLENSEGFSPFCIVRRMDFRIDKEKEVEIKGWEQC